MKKLLLFLVDDDELILSIMSNYLQREFVQYEIKTFESGEECLKNLNLKPNIIVLDYHLDSTDGNAENGLAILKKIKAASPKIEVVILTKNDNLDVAKNCIKYGAVDYVIKNENSHSHMFLTLQNINNKLSALESARISMYSTIAVIGFFLILILVALYTEHMI